jgi:hypothetical protein
MPHKKSNIMKPVMNNGNCDSPLQFNVKKSVEENKKVKPKQVFDGYKSNNKQSNKVKNKKY